MAQARFGLDLFHFLTFLQFLKAIPINTNADLSLFFSSQPLDGRVVETQNALKWIVHADAMRSLTLLQK